ncbi:NUDIX domain-containing protein [Brevundimonas sp. 2R-24]|uniref:NUDIX domain-containing protein n=1 Tax=Peiella sedimenti TaxID=3061083 RepID=A0ABT8SK18_9CAUL|nr:NUDIX domain-containing protein [Caulobacteraceae bacterium XZ-24]
MTWRRAVEPYSRPLFFAWSRLSRGKTLGVRGLAVDAEGRVLLVEHTYLHGWWLPGGGIDRGETAQDAVIRELREEAGVIVTAPPRLLSVHANEAFFPGDHVLVFRIDAFEAEPFRPSGEIARIGWFQPDALPETVNRGSRERIEEALMGRPISAAW